MHRPKTPTASREPGAQGCAKGADEGCPFSWLLLFGHAKRSKSGRPKDGPKALDLDLAPASGSATQRTQEPKPSPAGVGSRSDLRRLYGAGGRKARRAKPAHAAVLGIGTHHGERADTSKRRIKLQSTQAGVQLREEVQAFGFCESPIRALVHSPRALIGTRTRGPRACLFAPQSRLFPK